MEVLLVTPAAPDALLGNAVTANRWAKLLLELGHRVEVTTTYQGTPADLLIAIHARRSAAAAADFRGRYPERPILVALGGTDLYRDVKHSAEARRSLEIANRLVVLQPRAMEELPSPLRHKTRVIFQSAEPPFQTSAKSKEFFQVCVLAHLREVKNPLQAARAARRLPSASRIRIVHAGQALDEVAAAEAREEERRNGRYRWLEGLPREACWKLLSESHALVVSSILEGGANVVSEAIAACVPVLASRIPGNVGILGEAYPGYFEVNETESLAKLLEQAEGDASFLRGLGRAVGRLRHLVDPKREKRAWHRLLEELRIGASIG